jgi:membrane-anchored protein YejM (alkaline phosphatase superfamily)
MSLGAGAGARAPVRRTPALPAMSASPPIARNVLLVLTESVRFDSVCVEHSEDCKLTPFTNRAAPSRLPLLEVRSSASSTAISAGVIWSGLLPTEMTDAIRSAPMVFDYAHAAGYDTAYWSSQALMFTGSPSFFAALPLSHRCLGADLEPTADDAGASDVLLTQRVKRELPKLKEPWFAVVHYANTHFPYRVRGEEPFQPATESKAPEETAHFKNHYQNSVYAQDKTIADMLSALRASPAGAHTVVVYTSDHGEAFREHGQLGHTTSLYDEELHVPTWIDAPDGALTPNERETLASAKSARAWHVDLAPTLLDLMGLWDAPAIAPFRARMTGNSLLRPTRTTAVLPITNCVEIWGCSPRSWGVIKGPIKLTAREIDGDWRCWNVAADPKEERDLGAECADLKKAALGYFGKLPRDAAPMSGLGP